MKITFFSAKQYDREYFDQYNKDYNFDLEYVPKTLNERRATNMVPSEAICAFVNDVINADVIKILAEKQGVKYIAMRCAGFNNVDLDAAKKYNIKVCRVPAYSPECVAEHAVALLLTLSRKIHKAYYRILSQNFALDGLIGDSIHNKTVGVLGTGKIGKNFAKIMYGFGCKVLGYDVFESPDFKKNGGEYVTKEELLKKADIIALFLPLLPETRYIINKETIKTLKKGVVIINTGRGGLVNTEDLIDGIMSEHIGGFGADVYENEGVLFFKDLSEQIIPDKKFKLLTSLPNVLLTGHQAFLTKEALSQIASCILLNLDEFKKGKELSTPGAFLA